MCVSRNGEHLWYSDTFAVPMKSITSNWCVCCGRRNHMHGWKFTQHALERALDMALDAEEIKRAIQAPEVTQPSGKDYPDGYALWATGRIAVVVVPDTQVVVTFLWRGVTYERGGDSEPYRDNN